MTTCDACGHEDDQAEMYAQAGPGGGGMYCRNHNSCQRRSKVRRASEQLHRRIQEASDITELRLLWANTHGSGTWDDTHTAASKERKTQLTLGE